MTTMRSDDVHPGDVIEYHGELHRITRVERADGWAWPIACDDAGWAIALGDDVHLGRAPAVVSAEGSASDRSIVKSS
jgi:hypothetical protein